jgi:hypothetical protein
MGENQYLGTTSTIIILRCDSSRSALYGRGLAKLKKGDKVGSDADISAAKTIEAKIGDDFKRFGVQ